MAELFCDVAVIGAGPAGLAAAGSAKKVWWECSLGHVYKTWVYQRAGKRKYGCPVCGGRYKEERLARYKEIMGENPCCGENA